MQGTRSILATEGVRGFYHGLLPTLLRDVPELTLQFSMYESLRHAMQEHGQVMTALSSEDQLRGHLMLDRGERLKRADLFNGTIYHGRVLLKQDTIASHIVLHYN